MIEGNNGKTVIVSVIYVEKEWQETKACIEKCNVPVIYVDRQGTGSLAEAYNRGFNEIKDKPEYVWFVSNPTFNDSALSQLVKAMDKTKFAAIHPCFRSDHQHLRNDGSREVKEIKYIEFTCPIVKFDVFADFKLNEKMPYMGHDLDWSYRVKEAGYKIGVDMSVGIKHVYVRHLNRIISRQRAEKRKRANPSTYQELIRIYGEEWRKVLAYYG